MIKLYRSQVRLESDPNLQGQRVCKDSKALSYLFILSLICQKDQVRQFWPLAGIRLFFLPPGRNKLVPCKLDRAV